MAILLRLAGSNGLAPAYVERLLSHFGAASGTSPLSSVAQALAEPLTERELEVLRLLAGGLSNAGIAEKLVISVGTAKRHALNIYGKLGVNSRTQAVAKARELGLLD